MAMVELTEAQLKASELLASGESQVNVAKMVNVNPKTIQRWLKEDKFKADMERNVQLLKSRVNDTLLMNIEPIMQKLVKIALKSNSEKTSLDACIYALNRLCGTPTNKIQDITDSTGNNNNVDMEKMLREISDPEDNPIDLKMVK